MKKRSLAILAGGMSLALLLSSCGPSSAPTESPSSAPADETGQQTAEEPVTITYCNFNASGGNEETLQKMYEAFHEEHPNITVEIETIAMDDYFTQMQTRVAGGTAPDCYELNIENFASYANKGVLAEISGVDLSRLDETALSAFNVDGKQYGLPGNFSNVVLVYYDDYNALLAAPGEGWTVGKDVYGDVTYIKAYAASDSNSTYTLEGSSPVDADGQTYEAEYASLFGASTDTQASVNQNHSGYSGAGFVDKLEAAGAGVTFYAKVANAGDYDVTFRYANGDAAERSLSVYVNGAYIGKTIMPSTGHWDTWADCLMQLPLAAGNNIITLKHEDASGDTGYVNLDSCTVPFYPEVITAEAENAALYGTAGTNQDHWNYSGSGFVDGMTSAGAGAEFEITVPKDGSYEASIRYCNGTQATKDLNLYVNGSYIETISFGSIGGNWNEWQELTQTLELDEGRNVVALRYDSSNSGNVNLDKLSVKTEPDATISVPLVDNGGFERDTSQSSAWTEWHPDGQAVAYGVDSGSGTNPPESPYAGDKRAYFYSGSAYQQSIHQGINLPNGTYTVQAWIKVSNTAPDIGRMEVTGYGGDSIYVDMPYAGTGWRLVETDITVTTGYLDIGFYCSSLGGTTVHIDNVKILNK